MGINTGITRGTKISVEFHYHVICKQRRVKSSFTNSILVPSVGDEWGEKAAVSLYSSSSVKQGPDSVVKKFCCEALNRYVRPHSEKLEIFTDYRFALVYHRHEKV